LVQAKNIWWAGTDVETFNSVHREVIMRINDQALPFYSRFEVIDELLRTFLEDDDGIGRGGIAEGVWDFGKRGSPTRLVYTGFAALECGQWDLAVSTLRACKEKIMAAPEPISERVRAQMLPYVDQGISCAQQRRPWSSGSRGCEE
jgi:hypothetical protein